MAARAACNGDTLTPWGVKEGQECRSRFISDAVNQVNAPLLTAMNNTGRAQDVGLRVRRSLN